MAAHLAAACSTAAVLVAASAGTSGRPERGITRTLTSRLPGGFFLGSAVGAVEDTRRARALGFFADSSGSQGNGTSPAVVASSAGSTRTPLGMGKKALLSCAACAVSFKKKTSTRTVENRAFCSVACAAAGPTAMASGYGDVPPAFGGGGGAYASSSHSGSLGSDSDTVGYGGADKRRRKKSKRKKSKKRGSDGPSPSSRPVETDPACVKILTELDDATAVLTSPGEDLDRALRACVSSDTMAVDLEGVSMSRVGAVTLLQVAVRDSVFLFDVQALETAELFERAVAPNAARDADESAAAADGPKRKTLRGVLEDARITKLMFDCRVDSDALFHQHGVALRGVFDVQLADVASRRRKNLAVPLLSGMPKCAARHLAGASGATKRSLEALDADPNDRSVTRAGAASEAEAVRRVTEHLKTKVKALYAPDLGGDARLWALRPISEDARRYAALDVWLLLRIHRAMIENEALDEAWRARVVAASAHRETEYRALDEPVLQFRDPERAVAPDL